MYNKELFLEQNEKEKIAKTIFNSMESFYPIGMWNDEILDKYIIGLELISRNTILKYLSVIRKIHKFVCQSSKLPYNELKLEDNNYLKYIDLKRFRSKTITNIEEYISVKNLLYVFVDGKPRNFRDVVIFQLAWLCLTSKEIQHLKMEDIEKIVVNGKTKLILKLIDREVIVEDKEIIENILQAKEERVYYKERKTRKNGEYDVIDYIYSPYLIRPINNGKSTVLEVLKSPNLTLQAQLKKHNHPTIDTFHLSLEDIRRSKVICTILNSKKDIVNSKVLASLLEKVEETDLGWLIQVAEKLKEVG